MDFQRARSEEQRAQRRQAILTTTAQMLTEMGVAQLSLNELSRRVGLAKSNVLRYFESREAILLELLNAELSDWAQEIAASPAPQGSARERGDRLAGRLAASMERRPVMCDLISAQTSVLERNISTEAARHHKHATHATVQVLIGHITAVLPELDADQAYEVVATTLLMASAAWPHSQPSAALQAAYDADPALAAAQMAFTDALGRTLQLAISGLLARRDGAEAS